MRCRGYAAIEWWWFVSFSTGLHSDLPTPAPPGARANHASAPIMAGDMTNQGETFQRVSVAEAARHLGVSVATVRRRIRAGELEAETVLRPQGSAFVVRLPLEASAGADDAYDRDQEAGFTTRTQASSEQAMVSLIQATIGTVLGPLVGELAASRQANERQADRIAELERENGLLTAENHALEARTAEQDAEALRELSRPRWRPLVPWLAVVVLVAALATLVMLQAWPR
jgi:excisionase family DNA binding protein